MPNDNPLSPFSVLKAAIKAVPAVRFALGVAGVAAAIAIIVTFRVSFKAGLFGIGIMFFAMTMLLLFSRLAIQAPEVFRIPGMILVWSSLILFIAVAVLLITSVFWDRPLDLQTLLGIPQRTQPQPTTLPAGPLDQPTTVVDPDSRPSSGPLNPPVVIQRRGDEKKADLWERRGDLAAKEAIDKEIDYDTNGPSFIYKNGKMESQLDDVVTSITQARQMWKNALQETNDAARRKRLKEKISGSIGITCSDVNTDKIQCYPNASKSDVLIAGQTSMRGKHVKVKP